MLGRESDEEKDVDDLKMSSVDKVVLAWLVLPRKKQSTGELAKALEPLLDASAEDPKKVANDALARLKAGGLIERDTRLMLTAEGRRRALAVLDVTELPKRTKTDWKWAKKLLVLRELKLPLTVGTIEKAGAGAWLAKAIIIAHHQLSFKDKDPSPSDIVIALARRMVGLTENETFSLTTLTERLLLRDAPAAAPRATAQNIEVPVVTPVLKAENGLPGFAERVRKAAQASPTGRWHDNKVFISHVWNELQRQGAVGAMTFPDFQGRLIEASQRQLIELSRADLVQAMPREDVAASETSYLNASFHFVRLDDR
ncbi:Hypothetical protein A7982_05929 [Minicystis rosea]|nr:Hypothetical protein A7982_05929 [Minicystis rosea]